MRHEDGAGYRVVAQVAGQAVCRPLRVLTQLLRVVPQLLVCLRQDTMGGEITMIDA